MFKRLGLTVLFVSVCFGFSFAQMPEGFDVSISVDVNAFEMRQVEKSDVELRREAGRDAGQTIVLPFSDRNWNSGTGVSFSYDGGFFGARLALDVTTSDQQYYDREKREWFDFYPVTAGAMNAWYKPFGDLLKLSIGRGIGSGYADSQGGEALRVFSGGERGNWDFSRAVDDIAQGEGVLLEGFFGPVSVALAGRYSKSELFNVSLNPNDPPVTQNTKYASMEQRNFSYGARVGGELSGFAKLNASYIIEFDNITGSNYTSDREGVLQPISGEAEFTRHLFGVFASLYPFRDFGVSLGYNGIFTKYPEEIFSGGTMVPITMPAVLQQGINLNMRYSGINRLVLRTDHNVSFWGDKNFLIFGMPAYGSVNAGITAETAITRDYPIVGHLLVWNGLGVNYQFTDTFKLDLYVRNLFRRTLTESSGTDVEFLFTRNMTVGELKAVWLPRENMEFFIGLTLEHMITTLSEDIAKETIRIKDGFGDLANAGEIRDTSLVFKVPIGMTVKLR